MQVKQLALAGLALPLIAGEATAHHSFAMFDPEKLITQQGVVKEFEWTNPHVWLHIMAPDATGKPAEWSFEMQAVAAAMTGGTRSRPIMVFTIIATMPNIAPMAIRADRPTPKATINNG